MTSRLWILLALGASLNAFAASPDDCLINENTVLTRPWIFHCKGDVIIGEGVEIITHGHDLSIRTSKEVKWGSVKKPAVVRCLDDGETTEILGNQRCGRIFTETYNLDGALSLNCVAPDGKSCEAEVKTSAYSGSFRMNMVTGETGYTSFVLNGDARPTNVRWTN